MDLVTKSGNKALLKQVIHHPILYWGFFLIIVLLPLLSTLLLLNVHLKVNLDRYVPTWFGIYNDEIYYWRQIYTFSEVGFQGGYYTLNEEPAAASFTHYYAWGPMFPLLYGTIGHFLGWYSYSAVIVNIVLIAAALAAFMRFTRLRLDHLILLLFALATFWPLHLYLTATMQEGLHFIFAIILGTIFYHSITHRGMVSKSFIVFAVCFLALASSVRVTWSLLFLPFFIINIRNRTLLKVAIAVLVSVVFFGFFSWGFTYFNAPYGNLYFVTRLMETLKTSWSDALIMLKNQVWGNLVSIRQVAPIFLALYDQILLITLISILMLGISAIGWRRLRLQNYIHELQIPTSRRRISDEALFHILNVGAILAFNVVFYEPGLAGFRNMGPHVLLTILILVSFRRWWMIVPMSIFALSLAGTFLSTYDSFWNLKFTYYDKNRTELFREQVQNYLVYDNSTSNAWCNTVLVNLQDFEYTPLAFVPHIMGIHPGLGVSFVLPSHFISQMKSKYLLFSPGYYQQFADQINGEYLVSTEVGDIYLNRDAACD